MSQTNGSVVNQVQRTKDYSLFKIRDDNRKIRNGKVVKLHRSMRNKGWAPGSYVVVNKDFEIIDGQHRYLAASSLGIPITFVMEIKATGDTIRTLNTNQDSWTKREHLDGFVRDGNPDYIKLDEFMRDYPDLNFTECLMLCNNSTASIGRETFENGQYTVSNMSLAREWADQIMSLKPLFPVGYNRSIFVRALVKLFTRKPEFKFNEFYHKLKIRPQSIHLCGNVQQYIDMIEDIYNHYRKEKVNLRYWFWNQC